jgi:D-lactate dehydrogenase
MTQVVFFEAFAEERAALEKYAGGRLQAEYTWKTIQEWGEAAEPPAPIISVRTQSLIPMAWASRLKAILTRSTGYDHLSRYSAAVDYPPACGYLPLYCHRAVAEQALLLWMALLRRLPVQMRHFHDFNRDGLTGREAYGKHLLVVGVGRIGSEIVRLGQGLGMVVRGVDPVRRLDDLEYVSYEDGAGWADIVAVAMNLNAGNYGYFNAQRLGILRPGALLVNVARGEFTPLAELAAALQSGLLGGIGLDVYEDESRLGPQLRGEKAGAVDTALVELQKSDQVILTPHNAFNTVEAVERKAEQSIQQIEAFLSQGRFLWPVGD